MKKKIFLKRDSIEKSSFVNILRPYSPTDIIFILKKHGFEAIEIFKQWDKKEDVSQGEYIVLAQKNNLSISTNYSRLVNFL